MELLKIKPQILTIDLKVVNTDTRFCTPTEFSLLATKDVITNPSWSWHPCYPTDKYINVPHHYESIVVHCTKLGTLTKIPQLFRTSLVDENAPMLKLTEYTIRNYMRYVDGRKPNDDEGYILWLSDDNDLLIERVFPGKRYTTFYPIIVDNEYYSDYRHFTVCNSYKGGT